MTKEGENGLEWEFKALRTEILQNQRNCLQIIGVAITATGLIFGIALNKNYDWFLASPLIILIPATYLYLSQVEATFRIGSYIRLFIDPNVPGLNYETLLFRRKKYLSNLYFSTSLMIFYGLSALCCIIASVSLLKDGNSIYSVVVLWGILLIFLIHSFFLNKNIHRQKYYENFWGVEEGAYHVEESGDEPASSQE